MTSLQELYITNRRFYFAQWFHETFLQTFQWLLWICDATPDAEVNLRRKRALCKQENRFWTDLFCNKNFESSLGALLKQENIINRTLLFWDNKLATRWLFSILVYFFDAVTQSENIGSKQNWVRETKPPEKESEIWWRLYWKSCRIMEVFKKHFWTSCPKQMPK